MTRFVSNGRRMQKPIFLRDQLAVRATVACSAAPWQYGGNGNHDGAYELKMGCNLYKSCGILATSPGLKGGQSRQFRAGTTYNEESRQCRSER